MTHTDNKHDQHQIANGVFDHVYRESSRTRFRFHVILWGVAGVVCLSMTAAISQQWSSVARLQSESDKLAADRQEHIANMERLAADYDKLMTHGAPLQGEGISGVEKGAVPVGESLSGESAALAGESGVPIVKTVSMPPKRRLTGLQNAIYEDPDIERMVSTLGTSRKKMEKYLELCFVGDFWSIRKRHLCVVRSWYNNKAIDIFSGKPEYPAHARSIYATSLFDRSHEFTDVEGEFIVMSIAKAIDAVESAHMEQSKDVSDEKRFHRAIEAVLLKLHDIQQ